MRATVVGDLVKGQICLFGGLSLCVALRPEGLGANNGMSYYGVHWVTLPPYTASLLSAAVFTRKALRFAAPGTPSPDHLRHMADSFALLLVGILLTPYTLGGVVDWAHRGLGAGLFALQLILAGRLVALAQGDVLSVVLLLFQFGGGIVAAVYVLQDNGLLIHGEAMFQLGFGLLLIRTLPLVVARAAAATSPVERNPTTRQPHA